MARNRNTSKADIARRYRKKYKDTPKHALAKIMTTEDPLLYPTKEDARDSLKYITGKKGDKSRKSLGNQAGEFLETEHKSLVPYDFPEPDGKDLENYKLPSYFNDFILAADFHIPNHRMEPINAMMRYADENKINQFFLNGDLLDNTPFSRWYFEPVTSADIDRWFDQAENMLRALKARFSEIYWLEGNHDFWFKRWMVQHVEKLSQSKRFQLETVLKLDEIGVKFINQKYLVKAGHLNIVHGHVIFRGGGSYANAARMLYSKTKANTIASHVHIESSHTEPDLNDKVITTWTTGCMCTLRPDYQPYGGKACHGFAHVKVFPKGDFNVKNMRIQKGEIL